MKRTFLLALSVAATLAMPLAASARDRDDAPRWDRDDHRIVGRVVSFRPYNLQLDHGPHIFLHNGTIIRPRGLTLRDGMPVRVVGHRTDGGFAADEIDLIRRHDGDDRRHDGDDRRHDGDDRGRDLR